MKCGNALDRRLHVFGRDQAGTFELARCAGVARAPQEIVMIESMPHIVPATIAGVVIDHPKRSCKFVGRMGKAADHHNRRADRPS